MIKHENYEYVELEHIKFVVEDYLYNARRHTQEAEGFIKDAKSYLVSVCNDHPADWQKAQDFQFVMKRLEGVLAALETAIALAPDLSVLMRTEP